MLARMVLAAASETAMVIATAAEPDAALRIGQATLDTLLTRLFDASRG
ncbi:MAG: hypothetical protein ACR2JP_10705 [Acidimicrobiia bacterium]